MVSKFTISYSVAIFLYDQCIAQICSHNYITPQVERKKKKVK